MARARCLTPRALFAALAVAIAPHTALADLSAVNIVEMRQTLRLIEADLADGLETSADVQAFWARLGFGSEDVVKTPLAQSPFALKPTVLTTPAVPQTLGLFGGVEPKGDTQQNIDTADFRLMLAALAQTYTGLNNQAVINAQGPRGPVAVSVRSGTVTLADVRAASAAQGFAPRFDGALTAPVIIWPGATLRVTKGARLALARDTGAFVLVMGGTLEIDGALVESTGPENPHTPSFRPFVTVMGGATLTAKNSTFKELGFGQTPKFSGLSVADNLLNVSEGQIALKDNLFDGLQVVSISGATQAEITGNSFLNARGNTLNLISAPRAVVSGNLFAGLSPTNAIRIDQGSAYVRVFDNIFLSGERVAVLVEGSSDHVRVQDNLIWQRKGAGIKFLDTTCGLAQGNVILDNRQKGVEVRKSDGTAVQGNLIAGNGSAGIWVSAQSAQAQTSVNDNILHGNEAGIAAATGAEIMVQGNNFKRQLPRLLDGDIARLTRAIAVDLNNAAPLRFKGGQVNQASFGDLCGGVL